MALKVIFDEILKAILQEEKSFRALGLTHEVAFESACNAVWEMKKYEERDFNDVKLWLCTNERKREWAAVKAAQYNRKQFVENSVPNAYGGMRAEWRKWIFHQMMKAFVTEQHCHDFLKTVKDPQKKEMAKKYLLEHKIMKQTYLF